MHWQASFTELRTRASRREHGEQREQSTGGPVLKRLSPLSIATSIWNQGTQMNHFNAKEDYSNISAKGWETRRRSVTSSWDFHNAEAYSLGMDLRELQSQRDQSLQIYEAPRESLPDILFYDTVMNPKFEIKHDRLHVHVTEDVNEIIPYALKTTSFAHVRSDCLLRPKEVLASEVELDAHSSGPLKVKYGGNTVEKPIPGPDDVNTFLYDINALYSIHGPNCILEREATLVDDKRQTVKAMQLTLAKQSTAPVLGGNHLQTQLELSSADLVTQTTKYNALGNRPMREEGKLSEIKLMLDKIISAAAQRIGVKNILPYMHVLMAHLIASAWVPCAIEHIEGDVPWEKVAVLLNTLGRSGVVDAIATGPSFPPILSGSGRPLPEDFAISSLVWSPSDLPVDFFNGQIVDKDERALELPSHAAPRTESNVWQGCLLRSLNFFHTSLGKSNPSKVHEMIATVLLTEEVERRPLKLYETTFWYEYFLLAEAKSKYLPSMLHKAIWSAITQPEARPNPIEAFQEPRVNLGLWICCLYDFHILGKTYIQMGAHVGLRYPLNRSPSHIRARVKFEAGEFREPREALERLLNEATGGGQEENNRELLWVRVTLADVLRYHHEDNEALMLFSDLVSPRVTESLHTAAANSSPNMLKHLLEAGADSKSLDAGGPDALHHGSRSISSDIISVLINHQAVASNEDVADIHTSEWLCSARVGNWSNFKFLSRPRAYLDSPTASSEEMGAHVRLLYNSACLTWLPIWKSIRQQLSNVTLRKRTYKHTLCAWHMSAALLFGASGVSASNSSSRELTDAQDHIRDLVTEAIAVLMRWSTPTLLASGAVFATHRMTLLGGRRQRSEAVKTARAAAGASCLVAGMLADPRSTAEWVFPTFSAAMLLQYLFWRSLLSDQDQNLGWLALTVAIGTSADGLLCHLASSSQGLGYSLFMQLLPLSLWLTLMGVSCFLRQQSCQLRRTSGLILPY